MNYIFVGEIDGIWQVRVGIGNREIICSNVSDEHEGENVEKGEWSFQDYQIIDDKTGEEYTTPDPLFISGVYNSKTEAIGCLRDYIETNFKDVDNLLKEFDEETKIKRWREGDKDER